MKLSELLHGIRGMNTLHATEAKVDIHHIEMDSREVRPGTLFFCINGYTVMVMILRKVRMKKGRLLLFQNAR